jgi:hypothetical protein
MIKAENNKMVEINTNYTFDKRIVASPRKHFPPAHVLLNGCVLVNDRSQPFAADACAFGLK